MRFVVSFVSMGLIILSCCIAIGNGFNISPVPNYTFRQPMLRTFIKQTRSTYFGYSINLRKSGVLVGAPRAQSDVEYQRNINETGAVYRCSFAQDATTHCAPFYLDKQGNTNYENQTSNKEQEYRSEKKDYRMLGAAVDGHGSNADWFVACAPKMITKESENSYFLHGICYHTENIETPSAIWKIKPLRVKRNQYTFIGQIPIFNYGMGELGFSVHVTDDGQEILIGAPGVMKWRGTVVRYRQHPLLPDGPAFTGLRNVYYEHDQLKSVTHESVVPNPLYSGIQQDSYFGYAISSGRFLGTRKLLYVASAPQSRQQHGSVIIFDFINNQTRKEIVMTKYASFVGHQMGEYFGYSLLTEDFNSDGLPDLAVGAPMHSHAGEHDNGAVYVFLNGGELAFNLQIKITSSYELGGRFGTSLAKIGDYNRDGYGDIAIGAPFEGNGVVYIFDGSVNGLSSRPSQRLEPSATPSGPPAMFGYAISRGVDIDGNGYNDLAVGAPEAETVYVYRTYPIVRVEVRMNTTRQELPAEGGTFSLTVCWSADFPAGIPFNVVLRYSLDVDVTLRRARVVNSSESSNSNEVSIVGSQITCRHFLVQVNASPATLHQPVTINMEYAMAERATPPTTAGPFCEHCALLDPNEYNRVQERIPFRTGCQTETCQSDLKVVAIRWIDVPDRPYVLGSTKTVTFEVEIENSGENAYLPQVNVTVPASLQLAKTVPECEVSATVDDRFGVLCDLNDRLPVPSNARVRYPITFDVTRVARDLRELKVHAQAFTSSKEVWPMDNEAEDALQVREFSQIEILSKTSSQTIDLDLQTGIMNMTHLVKLHNNGPSAMRDLLLLLDVPLTYSVGSESGSIRCHIVNLEGVHAKGSYNDTPLEIVWIKPNEESTILKPKYDYYSHPGAPFSEVEESLYPTSFPPEQYLDISTIDIAREKRSLWVNPMRPNFTTTQQLQELPPNRTVFFNCSQTDGRVECMQLQARLAALPSGPKPVLLELQYTLDLDAIRACLQEQEDIFVVQLLSELAKPSDVEKSTFSVARNNPHTLVTRPASRSTPVWIYLTSSLGGLLLLTVITYVLFQKGFFDRDYKQKLDMLHCESSPFDELDDSLDSNQESVEL